MPIEDVQYLIKNSVHDTHMVLIDSGKRNKSAFPTPSEFITEFEEPFTNVFGIDVLDVSVSSTMYNIETSNNVFVYHTMWYNTGIDGVFFEENISREILTHPELYHVFNGINTRIVFTSSPPNDISYTTRDTGIAIAHRVTINTLEFVGGDVQEVINDRIFRMTKEQYTKFFEEVPSKSKCHTINTNGEAIFYSVGFIEPSEFFRCTQNNAWCNCIVFNGRIILEPGNYDLYGFIAELNTNIANNRNLLVPVDENNTVTFSYAFPFFTVSDIPQWIKRNNNGDLTRTARVMLCASSTNVDCMISLEKSSIINTLGFSALMSVSEDIIFKTIVEPSGGRLLKACMFNGVWTVAAPGVVNLTGVRYILLRCPEIESHMHSSFAYGRFCPGIGLFKLSTNQETVQQRLDFVNFVKKPFHPIGRLKKMTFRFELPNGGLYDFKGVDIFMLMQIKYYAPQGSLATQSLLNPAYDPDYVRYMVRALHDRSAHDDHSDSTINPVDVLHEQDKYDYSSEDEYGDEPYNDEVNVFGRHQGAGA